ncbi:GNAT family N-acetyltransferase [Chitinophaga ginsengisoli]|uniref:Ribosomal protein S18 acetylase RimI-like enzyme n=1 Tax=Chitinophaga ginsengisoli TaxID=363837 RepID=A0A2P8G7S9_9BACT|nr:GNAT family N-acetyltransferase [Chitinophaga ginsengisoli]PSL30029.1 ribosomal protein S18 acetylase RimI-like enzyme [Chitinophaga ginsengisoli]
MYQIRTATIDDIPLIQQLTDEIWRPTYKDLMTPEQLEYMIALIYSTASLNSQMTKKQHAFLLLYDEHRPIGFASYSTTDEPGIYKLQKIYVHGDYQGKGVGRFLLEGVIERVKAANATTLELDVKRDNKARFFYEKQGFTILKEKDTDIGNGYWMRDYVMRKPL